MRVITTLALGLVLASSLAALVPPVAADHGSACSLTQPDCAVHFLLGEQRCVFNPLYPTLRGEYICWAP